MSKNGYDFYLDKCRLPVAPEKLQIKINNANKTLTLIDEGEVNILKKAGLSDIEFECLIPQVQYPFAVYSSGFKKAQYFLDRFEELKNARKPFQFIVSRTLPSGKVLFSTDMKVSMEEYTVVEDVGDGFDLRVKIKLKQYREYGTKTVEIKSSGAAAVTNPRADSSTQDKPPSIGCEVIVTGTLHGSSYGDAPGLSVANYRGKINFINVQGSHTYHVTTPDGGWLGWVTADCIKVIGRSL